VTSDGDGHRDDEPSADDLTDMVVNPFYAVTISRDLAAEHAPMVTREEWIEANANLIRELGAEAWLDRLLGILERGFGG